MAKTTRWKLALAAAFLFAASFFAAAGGSAKPLALSLGWYGDGACDDALAQNPGAPEGCRYDARERDCGNGIDDDSDERADGADPDCGGYCGDGVCAGDETSRSCDSDCGCPPWSLFDPYTWTCGGRCAPSETDLDGDCAADVRPWGHACTDGDDNDGDGARDCEDSDCQQAFPSCLGGTCGDGVCGTGESWCTQDCGCVPSSESGGTCADGIDNDCDEKVDCADSGCAAHCAQVNVPVTSGQSSAGATPAVSGATTGGNLFEQALSLLTQGSVNPAGTGGAPDRAGGDNPSSGAGNPVAGNTFCGNGICENGERATCRVDCPNGPAELCVNRDFLVEYGPLNNCHDRSNRYCDILKGDGWDTRVVQCRQDIGGKSVTESDGAHTVNLYLNDPAKSEWCLIDVSDVDVNADGAWSGSPCCFTDYACSASDISLAPGSPGYSCASSLCGEQYSPQACVVLPVDSRAQTAISQVVDCADDRDNCLECCGALNSRLSERWLGDFLPEKNACEVSEMYSDQLGKLGQLCLASCMPDQYDLEGILKSLPPGAADAYRDAIAE